jgi:hypothetical protein
MAIRLRHAFSFSTCGEAYRFAEASLSDETKPLQVDTGHDRFTARGQSINPTGMRVKK